jgi:phage portal protein BeeE
MSYLDELLAQQQYIQPAGAQIQMRPGGAYASYYNPIDVSAPAYIVPSAYTLANSGYRKNEFVYAVMQKRAMAKAQARVRVMRDIENGDDEEMINHPLVLRLNSPNPAPHITWELMEMMTQITKDIAGFCAYEIEYSNNGEILAFWYMTPYFCSFLRGQQQPLRAIRYQPYGLQPMDIPFVDEQERPKILFFSDGENFDPLSDRVRFRSPLMEAFSMVEVDNAMTFFLNDFVKNGAKFAGMVSIAQTIDVAQAENYRRLWRSQHGGAENWSDPLILGQGATYSPMQMNFRDMMFGELDARTESRICNAFNISPIVVDARAGLDVSSYNNKKQAQQDWYYDWVIPSWRNDANAIGTQLIKVYEGNPDDFYVEFDLSDVYALKEDRDAQVKRGVDLYKSKLATKNEARKEFGAPPVEEGDDFAEDAAPFGASPFNQNEAPIPDKLKQAEQDAKDEEERKFRKFAKQRIKEGKSSDIGTYDFKYHNNAEQEALLSEFGITETAYKSELRVLADAINKLASQPQISFETPDINISVPVPSVTNVLPDSVPSVNITTPQRSSKAIVRRLSDGTFTIEDR